MTRVINPITKEVISVRGKGFFYVSDPNGEKHKYPIAGNEYVKPEKPGKQEVVVKQPEVEEEVVEDVQDASPKKVKKVAPIKGKKPRVPVQKTPVTQPVEPSQPEEEGGWWY